MELTKASTTLILALSLLSQTLHAKGAGSCKKLFHSKFNVEAEKETSQHNYPKEPIIHTTRNYVEFEWIKADGSSEKMQLRKKRSHVFHAIPNRPYDLVRWDRVKKELSIINIQNGKMDLIDITELSINPRPQDFHVSPDGSKLFIANVKESLIFNTDSLSSVLSLGGGLAIPLKWHSNSIEYFRFEPQTSNFRLTRYHFESKKMRMEEFENLIEDAIYQKTGKRSQGFLFEYAKVLNVKGQNIYILPTLVKTSATTTHLEFTIYNKDTQSIQMVETPLTTKESVFLQNWKDYIAAQKNWKIGNRDEIKEIRLRNRPFETSVLLDGKLNAYGLEFKNESSNTQILIDVKNAKLITIRKD